ncbi:Protein C24B5.1 [Aphelenchoides avenae]|nr:Protein C24B5.1 [Aphelenchus avenae]
MKEPEPEDLLPDIDWRNSSYYEDFKDFIHYEDDTPGVVAMLYLSYMPLCCFVGLTGNTMVWVLIRSNRIFRKLPSSSYLLTLSVMSSLFLTSLLSFWLEEGFLKDQAEKHSMFLCKCSTFLAHFCDFSSVWLIVLVGFERLTLLYRAPFRRRLINTKRQVIVLLSIAVACNAWIMLVAEINEFGGCDIKSEFEGVYNTFSLMETVICMIIPSFLIVVTNIFVILKLRAHMKNIPTSPVVSFNHADTVYSTGPSHTIKSMKISKASLCRLGSRPSVSRSEILQIQEVAHRQKRSSLRYTDLQLTRGLLVVTTVFIALNMPNYAYRIAVQFLSINDQSDVMQRLSFAAHIMLYTHHACLFYLYIFNSPQMRKRLVPTALRLLECYCLKNVRDFSDPNF